jgi:hypothetical protein
MTSRAKLYAAIVMTVLGPVVIIAVALNGIGALTIASPRSRGAPPRRRWRSS